MIELIPALPEAVDIHEMLTELRHQTYCLISKCEIGLITVPELKERVLELWESVREVE